MLLKRQIGVWTLVVLWCDCKWIKTILGEASISGKNGVVYAFDKFQISVTYQPDDGRCGADEFINLHYERG